MATSSVKASSPAVQAVSVKLPEFYLNDPAGWFLRAEAQFSLRGVTQDKTHFWHVLAALYAETSACFAGKAPQGERYSTLKAFLIKTYSPSCWERADCILVATDLGNKKPSALANHLLTLLSDHSTDILLQHIFLRCQPTYIQDALVNTDVTNLDTLGDRADAIMSCPCCPGPLVCNVAAPDYLEGDLQQDDPPASVNHLA